MPRHNSRDPHARTPIAPEIRQAIGDATRLSTRAIDLSAYASDASHYLYTPKAVLVPHDVQEVAQVLGAANRSGSRIVMRSGGTSLSGQASTDEILLDTRKNFRRIEVLDNGARVRVQPGATVRQVNARLSRYGYRLGPDPASEVACTIGGVIANNSSGMACGITENAYRTLESLVFVLPSGTIVDTASPDAGTNLHQAEPQLVEGLMRLRRRIRENAASVALIKRQFSMKNTMGYGINAFLDFDTPIDILTHLLIGSEGTLAFIAEATFRTVPLRSRVTTALAVYRTLDDATRALPSLVETGAVTLELMDSTSIRVGQAFTDAPDEIRGFDVSSEAALLVEYHADDDDALTGLSARGSAVLADGALRTPAGFSTDASRRAAAWKLRKGLYATVAGARPPGTTALLEDIVVPVPSLAATCGSLQELFEEFGYRDSVIFGHAKDGNIHFMLTDRFEGDAALGRLTSFTEAMVDLVLDQRGNLKAEHGTGRAMAPFVLRQYGAELYDVMREIKRLCDPVGILNPDVIISSDPNIHTHNIKLTEPIEVEADRCVECGYCESVCPSKDLTLTPRQRIVVRRRMASAAKAGDLASVAELETDYGYDAVDTCAVDGMCVTACPVLINTGSLVKRLRRETQKPVQDTAWTLAAKAWGPVTRAGSAALSAARALPTPIVRAATTVGRAALGADLVPEYSGDLPGGGTARAPLAGAIGEGVTAAVYLPACTGSMFGAAPGGTGVTEAFRRLVERAGLRVIVPDAIESLCCSTPWTSKGYSSGRDIMASRVISSVREALQSDGVVVVSDGASCTEGFAHIFEDAGVSYRTEDAVSFVHRAVLPLLGEFAPIVDSLVLHPTCSSTQMGLDTALRALAATVARSVTVPDAWGCCGFAGDRGMLHPELTESATAAEAAEVRSLAADAHASCNRTCEIGMSRATGRNYQHILELVEEASRSALAREAVHDQE